MKTAEQIQLTEKALELLEAKNKYEYYRNSKQLQLDKNELEFRSESELKKLAIKWQSKVDRTNIKLKAIFETLNNSL